MADDKNCRTNCIVPLVHEKNCPGGKYKSVGREAVRRQIAKNWVGIRNECRKTDKTGQGVILAAEVVGAMDRYGISSENARHLMARFGYRDGEFFAYKNFLRSVLLSLEPQDDEGKVYERRTIQKAKYDIKTPNESSDKFVDVMLMMRKKILKSWKEIQRTFRSHDPKACGFVSPQVFRQVLSVYEIMPSDEQFFHLLSYYDTSMEKRIPYNEFIRAFLICDAYPAHGASVASTKGGTLSGCCGPACCAKLKNNPAPVAGQSRHGGVSRKLPRTSQRAKSRPSLLKSTSPRPSIVKSSSRKQLKVVYRGSAATLREKVAEGGCDVTAVICPSAKCPAEKAPAWR